MFDDGLHEDGGANDGLYANRLTPEKVEGFRPLLVKATGANTMGEVFERFLKTEINFIGGQAPIITNTFPKFRIADNSPVFHATLLDDISGIDPNSIVIRIDGRFGIFSRQYDVKTGRLTFTAGILPLGRHTIFISIKDNVGQETSVTYEIEIVGGVINVLNITPEMNLKSAVPELKFHVTRSAGLDASNITVLLDGRYVSFTFGPDGQIIVIPPTPLSPLITHTVQIFLRTHYPLYQNIAGPFTFTFKLDIPIPTISEFSPYGSITELAPQITLRIKDGTFIEKRFIDLRVDNRRVFFDYAQSTGMIKVRRGEGLTGILNLGSHTVTISARNDFYQDLFIPFAFSFSVDVASRLQVVKTFGSYGYGTGNFRFPSGIVVGSNGKVYIVDRDNHRIKVHDLEGNFLFSFGSLGYGNGRFYYPTGIDVDALNSVYVTDRYNHLVQVFNADGVFLRQFGGYGSSPGRFQTPQGIALDSQGNIYVNDGFFYWYPDIISGTAYVSYQQRTQKFTNSGTFITQFATLTFYGTIQDIPFGEMSYYPLSYQLVRGVAVNANGYIFVADLLNSKVQVFDPSLTLIREFKAFSGGELTIDNEDRLYLADVTLDRIIVASQEGAYITQLGNLGSFAGQFNQPMGIAITPDGSIFVADSQNNRIQKLILDPNPSLMDVEFTSAEKIVNGKFISLISGEQGFRVFSRSFKDGQPTRLRVGFQLSPLVPGAGATNITTLLNGSQVQLSLEADTLDSMRVYSTLDVSTLVGSNVLEVVMEDQNGGKTSDRIEFVVLDQQKALDDAIAALTLLGSTVSLDEESKASLRNAMELLGWDSGVSRELSEGRLEAAVPKMRDAVMNLIKITDQSVEASLFEIKKQIAELAAIVVFGLASDNEIDLLSDTRSSVSTGIEFFLEGSTLIHKGDFVGALENFQKALEIVRSAISSR